MSKFGILSLGALAATLAIGPSVARAADDEGKRAADEFVESLEKLKGDPEAVEAALAALAARIDEAKRASEAIGRRLEVYELSRTLLEALADSTAEEVAGVDAAIAEVTAAPPAPAEAPPASPASPGAAFFKEKVEPILAANCFSCHGSEKQKGELRLDSRESVLKGGTEGPALVPGDPEASLLVEAIRYESDILMPPDAKLSDEAIATLVEWVKMGAPWSEVAPAPAPAPEVPDKEAAAPSPAEPPAETAAAEPEPEVAPEPAPPRPPIAFAAASDAPVSFSRQIRPILSDNCFACHGPDAHTRKAGLRLDDEASAFALLKSGRFAVKAGDVSNSEAYRRLIHEDPTERMPPPAFEKTLKPEQIELIGRWIAQGAKWEPHWSFVAPKKPTPPEIAAPERVRNEIDRFVLAKLEREGLEPRPEADRRTLIRRATLDLTGLPPTPAEIADFLADESPDAYEKVVDRLLASPRYGEHMARHWLDAARYADTNGYHIDNERYMWRWRDWVIESFNANKPFDDFTIEQIAGDLLPNATLEQKIGSGFNRNHMINFEGGAIPEEYRVNYVLDRLNTTSTVWLGMTVACAQCHDHKFDPISMKEFYGLYAFFNTVPENGLDAQAGNAVPMMKAPRSGESEKLAAFDARIAELARALDAPDPKLDGGQRLWEAKWSKIAADRWKTVDPETATSAGGATLEKQSDGSILATGENPAREVYELTAKVPYGGIRAIQLETLRHLSLPKGGTGRADNGNFVLTEVQIDAAPADDPAAAETGKFVAAFADFEQGGFPVAAAIDGKNDTGWAVDGTPEARRALFLLDRPIGPKEGGVVKVRLRFESHDRHALGRFRVALTNDPTIAVSKFGPWHMSGPFQADDGEKAYTTAFEPETKPVDLAELYPDGRRKWVVQEALADGKRNELVGENCATYLYREIDAPSDRDMTLALGSNDGVKLWVNGKVVLDRNVARGLKPGEDKATFRLKAGRNEILMKVVNHGLQYAFHFAKESEGIGEIPLEVEKALAIASADRSDAQRRTIREHYRRTNSMEWNVLDGERAKVRAERDAFEAAIPTTMVMAEMKEPRETFILERGAYDRPGEKVGPAVPAILPPLPAGSAPDRLGLARWLVAPEHPLTARVTVNRFWAKFFGTGLVESVEDFGVQGTWPSHPDLLDWLATDFAENGWDVKRLVRQIVLSAAYRRESKTSPELLERDPQNRLLARGPRFRLDAEVVRDQALAAAGLLVGTIGGPSVKPYQPPGIWEEVAYGANFTAQTYEQGKGDDLYRRSMYTFWKRQAPPPLLTTFDAPNREVCVVRRPRTNTPLQALALMNGTAFVEASRMLAQRVMKEGGAEAADRVAFAFEVATARRPTREETEILLALYNEQIAVYREDPEAAKMLLGVGEAPRDESLDPSEAAAWTTVTSAILNLDETATKG